MRLTSVISVPVSMTITIPWFTENCAKEWIGSGALARGGTTVSVSTHTIHRGEGIPLKRELYPDRWLREHASIKKEGS
jgi:hypothetical protein